MRPLSEGQTALVGQTSCSITLSEPSIAGEWLQSAQRAALNLLPRGLFGVQFLRDGWRGPMPIFVTPLAKAANASCAVRPLMKDLA